MRLRDEAQPNRFAKGPFPETKDFPGCYPAPVEVDWSKAGYNELGLGVMAQKKRRGAGWNGLYLAILARVMRKRLRLEGRWPYTKRPPDMRPPRKGDCPGSGRWASQDLPGPAAATCQECGRIVQRALSCGALYAHKPAIKHPSVAEREMLSGAASSLSRSRRAGVVLQPGSCAGRERGSRSSS